VHDSCCREECCVSELHDQCHQKAIDDRICTVRARHLLISLRARILLAQYVGHLRLACRFRLIPAHTLSDIRFERNKQAAKEEYEYKMLNIAQREVSAMWDPGLDPPGTLACYSIVHKLTTRG